MLMPAFLIITNLLLPIISAVGIYTFSDSLLWALVGALAIYGSFFISPIFAFLAYPSVEMLFSDMGLTIYSAAYVGVNALQFIVFETSARLKKG